LVAGGSISQKINERRLLGLAGPLLWESYVLLPIGHACCQRSFFDASLAGKESTMSKSKNETTSKAVASKAAKILSNPKSTAAQKSVAGSALTQRQPKK
jgi:hypothetical protein